MLANASIRINQNKTFRELYAKVGGYIKIHLYEIVCENVNWFHLVQNRVQWVVLVNTIIYVHLRVPQKATHFLTS
jgi:hypothetical protein